MDRNCFRCPLRTILTATCSTTREGCHKHKGIQDRKIHQEYNKFCIKHKPSDTSNQEQQSVLPSTKHTKYNNKIPSLLNILLHRIINTQSSDTLFQSTSGTANATSHTQRTQCALIRSQSKMTCRLSPLDPAFYSLGT